MAAYTKRYGTEFAKPERVRAYNAKIVDYATAVVRAHERADCSTYKTARRVTAQFILAVIEDMWVRELRDLETFYTRVAPKALLAHLQARCTC